MDKCNQKRVCLSTLTNITFTCIFMYPIHLFYVCLPLQTYLLCVFSCILYTFFPQMLLILCLTLKPDTKLPHSRIVITLTIYMYVKSTPLLIISTPKLHL